VSDEQPLLRVVRGDPTAEELAALAVVVAARATAARPESTPGTAWTDRARLVRRCPAPGPSAWRASGWRA